MVAQPDVWTREWYGSHVCKKDIEPCKWQYHQRKNGLVVHDRFVQWPYKYLAFLKVLFLPWHTSHHSHRTVVTWQSQWTKHDETTGACFLWIPAPLLEIPKEQFFSWKKLADLRGWDKYTQTSMDMIWHDMRWYDLIWFDVLWYDMTWDEMICFDIACDEMIWYDMRWHDMVWNDLTWYDRTCHEAILYDLI